MIVDAQALERLYRSHGPMVLRRARAMLGDEHEAQEALQEIFAALVGRPQHLRAVQSVVAYLYQATTHHCLNVLRHRRTSARLLGERAPVRSVVSANAEALAEVRSLLAQLPQQVATALVYHHLDGMTHDEIAAMLGCSRRKVGYLLERAQDSLAREEQSA
jgi:RNA polymerase sigma-70 factor (ECF subfamily)